MRCLTRNGHRASTMPWHRYLAGTWALCALWPRPCTDLSGWPCLDGPYDGLWDLDRPSSWKGSWPPPKKYRTRDLSMISPTWTLPSTIWLENQVSNSPERKGPSRLVSASGFKTPFPSIAAVNSEAKSGASKTPLAPKPLKTHRLPPPGRIHFPPPHGRGEPSGHS